jgi:hypothetical protein
MTRKEAINAYKARKPRRGAFSIRCAASGAVWVGTSTNVDTVKNRIWGELRLGGSPDKTLQAEWNAHGEGAFAYEILAELEEDVQPLAIRDLLKEQQVHWTSLLAARTLQ